MHKARITYRVSPSLWLDAGHFDELLAELEANRDGFDDVALFTAFTHSPVSLDTLRRRCETLPARLAALRARGFGAGINLLCAVGFFPENLDDIPAGIPFFTYLDGSENHGSFCHTSEVYRREYLTPMLDMLARTGPDFLWLDDDNRGHCFCDRCLALFRAETGLSHTRDTLRQAFQSGNRAEQTALRRQFLDFAGRSLTDHYALAARTVHSVNPAIELGGMDIMGNGWDNADFAAWSRALAGAENTPVRWRPGGGTYTDREPDEFILRKGMWFGLDAAWMPDTLTDRRSEVENFTYQRLKKSRHATALEGCVYNAFGMTGVAWNVLDGADDLEIYRPLMHTLTRVRPFLDAQVEADGVIQPRGIWNGWTPAIAAGINFDADWGRHDLARPFNPHASELFVAGLGAAFHPEAAEATILNSVTAWTLDDAAIERILTRGLYCDVETLQLLTARGFGRHLGFRAGELVARDARERLTAHPLNGSGAGHCRDCRQSFNRTPVWALEPLGDGAETLAELIDYADRTVAPCTLGIFRNELGGRVAVGGYFPLTELSFAYKIGQMKRLFDFLSGGTLSGWVASYHRIAVVFRPGAVSLVNASLDPAEGVELCWRTPELAAELLGMYGDSHRLTGERQTGGSVRFRLPELAPWHAYLLRAGTGPLTCMTSAGAKSGK